MKTQQIVITESGFPLVEATDGFVLYGNLYKGDGVGGLFGSTLAAEKLVELDATATAYTNFEFLDGLCLPLQVFQEYVHQFKIPTT